MENKKLLVDSFADQDLFNQTPMGNSIYALMHNSLAPNNYNNAPSRNMIYDPSLENIAKNDFKQKSFRQYTFDKINVTIEQENRAEKTMFKNKSIVFDANNNLLVAPLLQSIKDDGFNLKEHTINYYSNSDQAFIFLGKDPIAETSSIEIFELDPQQALRLKISPTG